MQWTVTSWVGIPAATTCTTCSHPASLHDLLPISGLQGCGRTECFCRAFTLEALDCRALNPQGDGGVLQCDGRHLPGGHHGQEVGGGRINWTENLATYDMALDDGGPKDVTIEPLVIPMPPARNRQVGGNHYRGRRIQPWDIWEAYNLSAFEGAIIKYLLRDKGNRLEDLKKARHTLDKLIEIEEGESE